MRPPVIQSERLTLDAVTPADTDAVLEYCVDRELQRYTRVPVPYTRADAEFFTGEYATEAERGELVCLWAIRAVDSAERLVGTIELRFDAAPSAELGYWLGAPLRGRGIMTEAVALVAEYALDPQGFALEKLRWDAVAGNYASGLVAQRNGFTFLGERSAHTAIRGRVYDAWLAELRADDSREPVDGWPL